MFIPSFFTLGKIYSVDDLKLSSYTSSNVENRSSVKILVVDDQGFPYTEQMRDLNYNIKSVTDLETLDFAKAYDIIICDVRGVGKKLAIRDEGIGLIRDVHNLYPYKEYAVYTANQVDLDMARSLKGIDIEIVPKIFDKDNWNSLLDKMVKSVLDPRNVWLKMRTLLLNEGLPLVTVLKLEHKYVWMANHHKLDAIKLLSDSSLNISSDIRAVVNSLIANIVSKSIGL